MTFSLEPLRFLLHPVALLAFAAAAQSWIAGADTRAIVAAILGVLIAAATEAARKRVTPDVKVAGQAGQSIVEVLLIIFLVLVVLLVLFRLA
jgi:hypothetical protein